ncbi:MAG: RNA 2',3'-cyclic phosphodiesterase [Patescibacteria group bacterium]|nr:RNA 2',3'-cyclic phosphodiesterase [Patescibacteria group bacterium]MDD4610344.1 RNA 2',3'-cyclic phosphodiesterase [Patescibacteria group bacterium]
METKRLFLALNLSSKEKDIIFSTIEVLAAQSNGIKWVGPENLHITLRFLGDIDTELEEEIKLELEKLENNFGELKFQARDLSAFPNSDEPRVIYLDSFQTNGQTASNLYYKVKEMAENFGIRTDNRPWTPHITLGRVKNDRAYANLKQNFSALPFDFSVTSFELMESELTFNGSVYRIVRSYKL